VAITRTGHHMLRRPLLASALCLLVAACGGGSGGSGNEFLQRASEIPFETILHAWTGGVPARQQLVARTQAEWEHM
jgi:hypothetical protein